MLATARHTALFAAVLFASPAGAQRSDQPTFTVGTATAARGTRATGIIAVPAGSDSALDIPVAVMRGTRPGPIVAFVAGSHGTEYSSIVAMQRLIPRIDPARLGGTVIIVPIINIPSFESMTPHLDPVDRKSMNGNYPGDANGTQTPRALALMTAQVLTSADVVVDLHGGDLDENLRPFSYWFRGGRLAQDSAALRLVRAFGLDHIIVTDVNRDDPATGRTLSGQALIRGKTVVVAEAGRSGLVTDADLRALVDGSLNLLAALGMIDRPVPPLRHPVWLNGAGARVAADSAGMFFASVARDTRVTAGETVGYTTDFLGHKTGDVKSPIAGLVAFIRGVPSMWPHATLVDVLPVLVAPGPWAPPRAP
jgi:hypothetical protein